MDTLPNEIYIAILAYLDYNADIDSKLDTLSLLEAFPRELSQNDWGNLFILRFPRYFNQNLYIYDINKVYVQCLRLSPIYDNGYFPTNNRTNDALKYLMLNRFIGRQKMVIAELDDIELFNSYFSKSKKLINLEDIFIHLIEFNSLKILKYINKSFTLYDERKIISGSMINAYSDFKVSIEMTKILFNLCIIDFGDLVTLLIFFNLKRNYFDMYNYIFGLLPDKLENSLEFVNRLIAIHPENFTHLTFMPLWNKYKDQLTDNDIIKLYKNFIGGFHDKATDDFLSILTEIAHHPVIEKLYLKK